MTKRFKQQIKTWFPFLVPLAGKAARFYHANRPPEHRFNEIYRDNGWKDSESYSGPGSNLIQTATIRKSLPLLVEELGCKSFLDVPCGDFNWMQHVELNVDYLGGDIVAELVKSNQEKYGNERRKFVHLDLLKDKLPRTDLVFSRDCLVHLSNKHILRALKNIKASGSTYLLTTTFVDRRPNEDIPTGHWRPINLQLPPFNLPEPIRLFDEECPLEDYRDKSLGLWKTSNLPDF